MTLINIKKDTQKVYLGIKNMKKLLIISILLGSAAYTPVYAFDWTNYKAKNAERFNLNRTETKMRNQVYTDLNPPEESFYRGQTLRQLKTRRKIYKSRYQNLTRSARYIGNREMISSNSELRSRIYKNREEDMFVKAAHQLHFKQRLRTIRRVIRETLGKPIPERLRNE